MNEINLMALRDYSLSRTYSQRDSCCFTVDTVLFSESECGAGTHGDPLKQGGDQQPHARGNKTVISTSNQECGVCTMTMMISSLTLTWYLLTWHVAELNIDENVSADRK